MLKRNETEERLEIVWKIDESRASVHLSTLGLVHPWKTRDSNQCAIQNIKTPLKKKHQTTTIHSFLGIFSHLFVFSLEWKFLPC